MVNDVTKFNEQNKFNVKLKLWKKKKRKQISYAPA